MRLNPHCIHIAIVLLAISLLAPFVRTATNPLGRSGLSYSPQSSVLSATTDPRKYSFIYLSNGIPMVLVSDTSTPQASAAVSVGVGSWGDPIEYPGLAHFLEHCLFLGSEAFPGENAYGSYLAANGGGSNAFTSQDRTVYYFTVDAPALGGALDRFSGFFTSPLINATSIHREVRAVNAEHAKNLQSDGWRAWQLLKHLSSPQSPMHGFSTGNSTTLDKPGVRSALLAFAARHYHAGNMVASIVGPQGIEELRGLAERAFSGVRAGPITSVGTLDLASQPWVGESREVLVEAFAGVGAAAERIDGLSPPPLQPFSTYPLLPLSPGMGRGLMAAFSPIGQGSDLTLTWPLNGEESAFGARVASAALITGALNDESEGGLQSVLKREGFIEGMSAGADLSTASLTLFSISFTLSPDAVEGIRGEAAAASSSLPGKGMQALTLLLGRISNHLFSYLDTLEGELLNSTHHAWASMVSEAYGSGGSGGVERLRGGLGLSKEELEELELPLLPSSSSSSSTPSALLQRADWREGTQEALIQRAVTLASRTTYRHYYGVVPGAPPKAVEGVGGTLASWPTLPGDTMGRLWSESVAYGQAQFLYPGKELSVESRVMALVENLWLGLGPMDVLLPPTRRVYQPLAALRVLRQLVPGSAIGLLSSPLIGVLEGEGGKGGAGGGWSAATIGATGGGTQALLSPWSGDTPLHLTYSEPIYGTCYAFLPLLSCIAQALGTSQTSSTSTSTTPNTTPHLPPPNPFIPTSFELVSHAPYHSALGIEERAREVGGAVSKDASKGKGSPPILALSTTAQTYGWARDVKVWWTPFIHLPSPRLAIGIEVLFHSNHTYATPLDALLTQLYLSCAVESATEFMSNPRKAGATLTPRFNGVTGGLEILGACFTSTDSFCQPFLAAALPKALPNPGGWSPSLVATRLSLIAQGLADAEFQAQPYTQAFTLAALWSGEKIWEGRQILEAAAGLVGEGGGSATSSTLSSAALAQVVSSGAIKAGGTLVSALTTHFQMLFMRGLSSVQVTVGGNIRLPSTLALATGTILPFLKGVVDASSGGGVDFPTNPAPPPPRPIKLYNLREGGGSSSSSSSGGGSSKPVTLTHPGANPVDANCAAVFLLNAPPPPPSPVVEGATVTSTTLWYAAVTVLGEIIREPAFDELRTKQALGYIASAGAREVLAPVELCASSSSSSDTPTTVPVDTLTMEGSASMVEGEGNGGAGAGTTTTATTSSSSFIQKVTLPVGTCRVPSLYTLVQGITLPALGLEGRVEGFIDTTFPAFLSTLTEEGLKAITESLAKSLEEGEKDTGEAFGGVWSKVVSRTYDWRGWAREAAGLRALTVNDVVRVWGVIVGEGRREFWGLIQGKMMEGA